MALFKSVDKTDTPLARTLSAQNVNTRRRNRNTDGHDDASSDASGWSVGSAEVRKEAERMEQQPKKDKVNRRSIVINKGKKHNKQRRESLKKTAAGSLNKPRKAPPAPSVSKPVTPLQAGIKLATPAPPLRQPQQNRRVQPELPVR